MNTFRHSNFPFYTTKQDIELLFEMVRKSNYVAGNSDYKRKAENTKIEFAENDNTVNAWAQSFTTDLHGITILNGICNTSKVAAIALAYFKQYGEDAGGIGRLALCMRNIGHKIVENSYYFPISSIQEVINEMEYDIDDTITLEAKSYAAGGILSVIAHEQGHICLSHTLREVMSDETSRNDERQADLFGCNVSVTTPFGSHIVLATLFSEVVFAWMQGNNEIATTHPISRERVYNTVNAHDVVLKTLGITMDNIDWFLPPKNGEPVMKPNEEDEEVEEVEDCEDC